MPDFDYGIFSLRRLQDNDLVPECRWTSYLLYAGQSRMLFEFVRDIFFAYLKNNDRMIDYFFLDYCIALAYKHIPEIQKAIDNIPFTNPDIHWLQANINRKYDEQSFKALTDLNVFCKMTYKYEFKEKTDDGFLTYYGYIKKQRMPP